MTFNLNFQKKSVPICHKRKWCKTKVSKFRTYTLWSSISRVMIFLPKANLKIINYTHLSAKLNMIPTKIHKSILTSMKIWNENVYSPYRRAEPGFQKQKRNKSILTLKNSWEKILSKNTQPGEPKTGKIITLGILCGVSLLTVVPLLGQQSRLWRENSCYHKNKTIWSDQFGSDFFIISKIFCYNNNYWRLRC